MSRSILQKVHITADPGEMDLAVKAARWLLDQPASQHDAILVYLGRPFFVRRNKSSISVFGDYPSPSVEASP